MPQLTSSRHIGRGEECHDLGLLQGGLCGDPRLIAAQRQAAQRDIAEAIASYRSEAGDRVALGLIDAPEGTFDQISQNPNAGANRYGHALQIEGLKPWPLKRFPHVVFTWNIRPRLRFGVFCMAKAPFRPGWLNGTKAA